MKNMRTIDKIIIHCSDSEYGTASLIDSWHKERGWSGIGYHFVVLNGRLEKEIHFSSLDGTIEVGRSITQIGAHCHGDNTNSIGICLIGKNNFSSKQIHSISLLIIDLMHEYGINISNVVGHYETNSGSAQGKTCPNIDMYDLRRTVSGILNSGYCGDSYEIND